jgi:hypothetical protein
LPHLRRWQKLTARFLIEWQGLPIASQVSPLVRGVIDKPGFSFSAYMRTQPGGPTEVHSWERRAWRRARELVGLGADVTPHAAAFNTAAYLGLRKAIEAEAFRRDRTVSWVVRHILVSWLQDQEMRRQSQAVPAE